MPNDITIQTQQEKDAIIRTNMRNAIKRVKDLRAEANKLAEQLKAGIGQEAVKSACGEHLEAFEKVIRDL